MAPQLRHLWQAPERTMMLPHSWQAGASVSLVIRAGETIVPEWRTVLRHGDELLVVTPRSLRRRTEQRLRLVSSAGRLAGWRGPEPRVQPD